MFRASEDTDETPQHQLEAPPGVGCRQLRDRRLVANNELEIGDQTDDELPIRIQRLAERITPAAQLAFALREERADQALKGLRQGRIGDVTLVLIELAGGEQPSPGRQRPMQLI